MKNARADITGRPFFMVKKKGIPEYRVRKKTKKKNNCNPRARCVSKMINHNYDVTN